MPRQRANIRVKFSGRISTDQNPSYWTALLPKQSNKIGNCEFIFDPDERDYDWLVVYEDLMYPEGTTRSERVEPLACARENTLLITQEPSAIKIYGPGFLAQYGHILSAQAPSAILHKNHIWEVSPIRWFYGRPLDKNDHNYTSVTQFRDMDVPEKTHSISTVCSDKQMTPTLKKRFDFTARLNEELGDHFDWFGRGIRPINDKSEAMDRYKYHIAIENFIAPHYWTEKIADCYLAYCLPLYYGPDNIEDYFSPEAFIRIDIDKPEEAIQRIKAAVENNEYEKRFDAICEAREKVLTDYNVLNIVARHVTRLHKDLKPTGHDTIMGRHAFRNAHPFKAATDVVQRGLIRLKNGDKG